MDTMQILVVDDEANIRRTLALCLEQEGYKVTAVSNAADAVIQVQNRVFDLVFVDIRLGQDSGLDLLPLMLAECPWLKLVIITAYASIETAVEAMRRGAFDYLPKPFTPAQVLLVAQKAARMRQLEQQVESLQQQLEGGKNTLLFSTQSPAMQKLFELARQVAVSDSTVLLRGPSGTGKSVLARAIHSWSKRGERPFITVSCPSLNAELLESELFGHVKGAFTGALRDQPGRIAAAQGGTLFLDEIGDLPAGLQPKLLRFLQEREYEMVGDNRTCRADVRIIAATNVSLEDAVKAGTFREDLFYRLAVFPLELPTLKERVEDTEALALAMLAGLSDGKEITGISAEALAALRAYTWPGNLRELQNIVERAVILCPKGLIAPEHLGLPNSDSTEFAANLSLAKQEELHIRRVLAVSKSLQEAADLLQIDLSTLWRKRKQYGI